MWKGNSKLFCTLTIVMFVCIFCCVPAVADELGSASVAPVSCDSVRGTGGVPGATCYVATVDCPDIAEQPVAMKVNLPAGTSIGTVIFTPGGGGGPWWDVNFEYGAMTIQNVINAGYTAVQFDFEYPPQGSKRNDQIVGWLTGPGGARALSCRWATLAQWVHDNLLSSGKVPLCAASASAGASAAAYAVAFYGLDSEISMLEQTSGPVFDRIDNGCLCNSPDIPTACGQGALSECYEREAGLYVDPTYQNKACSTAQRSHHSPYEATFLSDSLDNPQALTSFPNTYVHFLFGGQDASSAVPQATAWQSQITASNGQPPIDCVPDASHEIADSVDGALRIAADVIAGCR
ncbi:MAG: hypothetical protein H0X25_01370 [Acidobacteriales bacterium]|nr:hypothetical protein [Terriglobales bacterium]